MITFYKNEDGVVVYKDDTYLEEAKFAVERPATEADIAAHAAEHALYVTSITPAPVVEPAPAVPSTDLPSSEGAM
jgi:hypothetical protein